MEVDLTLDQLQSLIDFLKVFDLRLLNFDFDLVTNSKFIFDVLRATIASEYSSTHHDSHLRRECFRFFHRMGGQDDGALLVTLGYLFDDLPHEAPSLGVHSGRWFIKEYNRWITENRNCNR